MNRDRNPDSANLTAVGFSISDDNTKIATDLHNVPRFLAIALGAGGTVDTTRSPSDFGLYAFIWTSTSPTNPGGILNADLCSFSFCVQRRDVLISTGNLKSTVVNTYYADRNTSTRHGSNTTYVFLIEKGNFHLIWDLRQSQPSRPDWTPLFTGNVSETTASQALDKNSTASANLIYGLDASHDISMTMQNVAVVMTNAIRDQKSYNWWTSRY